MKSTSALLGALLHLGCCTAAIAAPAASQKDGDRVRVTAAQMHQLAVAKVELHPFRLVKAAIGQIAYNEDTSTIVLTPFTGRVTRLIAKIGDKVQAGDPLFEVDSPEVVQPQNDFIAAAAALNKARSQLNLAQIAERRARDLFEGKAGPLKELQSAEVLLVAATNDLRAAESSLEAVHNRLRILGRTEEQITALRERGAIVRSTPVFAPIAGTVVARKVGPGQLVRSDLNEPLYSIADLTTMWLKAYVPENDIHFVQAGQDVEVRVTALPNRVFNARIAVIGAASDAVTRRVVVRSELPNPDGALKAEMFASFIIHAGTQPTPAAPMEAVIREGDHATVWVQVADDMFQRRTVRLGIEQAGRVQIVEGLKAGETVVTRGAIFVDNEWRQ